MKKVILAAPFLGACLFGMATQAQASTLYRAYNPNTGEHLYTQNGNEIPSVVRAGWRNEGTAWQAPSTGAAVYRMFNPNNGGDHFYTLNGAERDHLKQVGWRYEGISWESGGSTPVYRLYNPNAKSGTHHYTTLASERDHLRSVGWRYEGIAFYSGNSASAVQPLDKIGNSGILEKSLITAGKKADAMRKDPNSPFYSGWFIIHEGATNKGWAFTSRTVRMSNGETWYTIDFYVDYV